MEIAGRDTPSLDEGVRNATRTVEQARSGAHNVIDKASDAARPMVERVASGAHRAVDSIAGAAGQAAETLGVKGEQLKDAQLRAMEQCRGYVRDNPLASLGIAVAAGFILSWLVGSRSR
jgi:ElaB/YqjD/DUF883 family membrane-anchored ribosome-binding protein